MRYLCNFRFTNPNNATWKRHEIRKLHFVYRCPTLFDGVTFWQTCVYLWFTVKSFAHEFKDNQDKIQATQQIPNFVYNYLSSMVKTKKPTYYEELLYCDLQTHNVFFIYTLALWMITKSVLCGNFLVISFNEVIIETHW